MTVLQPTHGQWRPAALWDVGPDTPMTRPAKENAQGRLAAGSHNTSVAVEPEYMNVSSRVMDSWAGQGNTYIHRPNQTWWKSEYSWRRSGLRGGNWIVEPYAKITLATPGLSYTFGLARRAVNKTTG